MAADAPVERTTGALSSRDRVGRALLWLAALGAVVSAVSALSSVVAANDSTRVVEVWRMYGLAVFAGLFVLLALRPRQYRGVWELAIANKLALTVTGMALLAGDHARGAGTLVVWDGALSLVLIAAYVSCRAWRASPALHRPGPSGD